MPTCSDCVSYAPKTADHGDCRINGETTPDRDSEYKRVPNYAT
jgi:hypothetical protein